MLASSSKSGTATLPFIQMSRLDHALVVCEPSDECLERRCGIDRKHVADRRRAYAVDAERSKIRPQFAPRGERPHFAPEVEAERTNRSFARRSVFRGVRDV
jgi:hypothetical protein